MDESGLPFTLTQLLRAVVDRHASDLHITTGTPPQLRVDGTLLPLKTEKLSGVQTKRLCYEVLTEAQKVDFETRNEIDFSFGVKGLARFRANLFMQRGSVGGVFRQIPFKIRSFDDLGLPRVISQLTNTPSGLVLVTGPTGSGKTTTLAAIIDKINSEQRYHILTVEDPIEFLHPHKLSIVNQREVGTDTRGFKDALRHALRQDPDVVLIGELRDLETIQAALTISETGHLVFATLHTNNAVQTINRIIDVFPPHQQPQVRAQLSFVLQGVVSQALLKRADQPGRCLALEILTPTPGIRNLIREDKLHQVYSAMQMGQAQSGMQTLNQSLFSLHARRLVHWEEALSYSTDPEELHQMAAKASRRS